MNSDSMTFFEHLQEFRKTIIRCVVIILLAVVVLMIFNERFFSVLIYPFEKSTEMLKSSNIIKAESEPHLIAYGYEMPIMSFLKATIYCSLFLSLPLVILYLWLFVEKGLYKHEKKMVALFAFLSVSLFLCGVVSGFLFFLPFTLYFLVAYSFPGQIEMVYSFSSYLDFVILLTVVVGLIFQIPIIMGFLSRINLVTWSSMLKSWRYFLVSIFIIAAIITPPDVVSQTVLALPMIILYFLGIGLAYILRKKVQTP